MAKVADSKKPSKSEGGNSLPDNITLITNGFRVRVRAMENKKIATLEGGKWETQEELQALWEERVTEIEESDYVLGSGTEGIFSERFGTQVSQIAPLKSVWCYTTGLGMVSMTGKYPQYDLGDYDASIKRALGPREISEREWWNFVTNMSGNSITSVIQGAVKAGHRIIMAVPALQYSVFRDDMKNAIKEVGADVIREHVRIVGPELESVLPTKFLPCLMPYDREALDRLVPGVKTHGSRRLARLYIEMCKPEEDGAGNPLDDYKKMVAAFNDEDMKPIEYDTGVEEAGSRLKKLDEDGLREKVEEYAEICGPIALRISRMLREDGFSASVEAVEAILEPAPSKGSSAKGKASTASTSEKPKGKAAPASKSKAAAAAEDDDEEEVVDFEDDEDEEEVRPKAKKKK